MIELLLWIAFGAVIGWIASIIMGTNAEQGALANIIIGILGALLGGFIARTLGSEGVTGFNFRSLVISVLGAIALLFVVRMFSRGAKRL